LTAQGQRAEQDLLETDPDLTVVIDAWDRLPEAVRAGIVAMVRAAGGNQREVQYGRSGHGKS
jgi:hypothetical protein